MILNLNFVRSKGTLIIFKLTELNVICCVQCYALVSQKQYTCGDNGILVGIQVNYFFKGRKTCGKSCIKFNMCIYLIYCLFGFEKILAFSNKNLIQCSYI